MASKSLGTLTLDLVAKTAGFVKGLTAAERASDKWRKNAVKNAKLVGSAIGASIGATATSLAAIAALQVKSAAEISRLSAVAGTGAEEFQKYAAGARQVGVEQEKLADIFKDVNDKVGDFLQNGAGPLKDFFEKIAPQIGITAEQFKNLSGPQALELYVGSLEKAKVSQSEMTFYMEAIASDAALLYPLLRDGAEGFREFGQAAEDAGAILGQDALTQADELRAMMFLLDATIDGLKNTIGTEIIRVLVDLGEAFSDVAIDTVSAKEFADDFSRTIRIVAATAVGSVASLQLLLETVTQFKNIASAAKGETPWYLLITPVGVARSLYQNFADVESAVSDGGDRLQAVALRYATILSGIWGDDEGAGADPDGRVKRIAELLAGLRKTIDKPSTGSGLSDTVNQLEKSFDSAKIRLEKIVYGFGDAKDSSNQLRAILFEIENGALKGISEEQQKILTDLAKEADSLDDAKRKREAYLDLVKSLRTEEEQISDTLRERLKIIDEAGKSSDTETTQRAINDALGIDTDAIGGLDPSIGGAGGEISRLNQEQADLERAYQERLDILNEYRQERADLNEQWDAAELVLKQQHEDAIAGIERARQQASLVAAEDLFGSLADITRQFAGEQSAAYKVLFAIEKGVAIARSIIAIQEAIAIAATSGPYPANLAAMAQVAAATAGLVSTIASTTIQGQAHDGLMSVPKTGTYLLEKGERVTTAETSAKLDRKLDSVGGGSNIRIVNSFDPADVVGGYMGSSAGERVVMNIVQRNARTIRSLSA